MQRLQVGLQSLQYQHSALVQALHSHTEPGPSLRTSPLLATAKEEEEPHTPSSAFSTLGRTSIRSHRLSVQSDASIWYDAPEYEGAEEFVLDDSLPEDSQGSKISEITSPGIESIISNDMESSNTGDSETDTEDDAPLKAPELQSTARNNAQLTVRRSQLPSPPVGDEGSLFTVLKKNVGKVLTVQTSHTHRRTKSLHRISPRSPYRFLSTNH